MKELKIEKIKKKLRHHLDKERYEHTLGVMYTAAALAMVYCIDMNKALLAGLLHDCAKCISGEKKIRLCEKYGLEVNSAERKNPGLLHSKLGAHIAKVKYGVQDDEVLDAICYHTTGRPNMTMLDKIIYIADYIEPNRSEAPNLEDARRMAFVDIDACLYMILKDSLNYLKTKNEAIDPMTEKTFQYYQEEIMKK